MELTNVEKRVEAEHGVVASFPNEFFGYFGWPSVTRMDDGTLVAAASGLRNEHVCPFGRSVILVSRDEGRTWTTPTVVNDLPLDDRDAGIVSLGGKGLLISWFITDTRRSEVFTTYKSKGDAEYQRRYEAAFRRMEDGNTSRWTGAWVRISADAGETWGEPIKVEHTAPHGPIRLRSGKLLYLGKEFVTDTQGFSKGKGGISCATSADGRTWKRLGEVPLYPGSVEGQYHEPHVVELPGNRLLGVIRVENEESGKESLKDIGLVHFSMMQTESADGGKSWSRAEPFGFHGSPPHLLLHSSGALVCVYGYRKEGYGERAMISRDAGKSWRFHYIIRDDGPDGDLGYPCSVELPDGSIFTVYYQKLKDKAEKCSLLWSRWKLPE